MLMAKVPAASMRGQVLDEFATKNSTGGGASEREVNELAARPTGSPSSTAVMIVTPVAKWPSTSRNRLSSGTMTSSVTLAPVARGPRGGLESVPHAIVGGEHLGAADPRDEVT